MIRDRPPRAARRGRETLRRRPHRTRRLHRPRRRRTRWQDQLRQLVQSVAKSWPDLQCKELETIVLARVAADTRHVERCDVGTRTSRLHLITRLRAVANASRPRRRSVRRLLHTHPRHGRHGTPHTHMTVTTRAARHESRLTARENTYHARHTTAASRLGIARVASVCAAAARCGCGGARCGTCGVISDRRVYSKVPNLYLYR